MFTLYLYSTVLILEIQSNDSKMIEHTYTTVRNCIKDIKSDSFSPPILDTELKLITIIKPQNKDAKVYAQLLRLDELLLTTYAQVCSVRDHTLTYQPSHPMSLNIKEYTASLSEMREKALESKEGCSSLEKAKYGELATLVSTHIISRDSVVLGSPIFHIDYLINFSDITSHLMYFIDNYFPNKPDIKLQEFLMACEYEGDIDKHINWQNGKGMTLLMFAVKKNLPHIATQLWLLGADPHIECADKSNALVMANNHEMQAWLNVVTHYQAPSHACFSDFTSLSLYTSESKSDLFSPAAIRYDSASPLVNLPSEMHLHMSQYLAAPDITHLRLTCRNLYRNSGLLEVRNQNTVDQLLHEQPLNWNQQTRVAGTFMIPYDELKINKVLKYILKNRSAETQSMVDNTFKVLALKLTPYLQSGKINKKALLVAAGQCIETHINAIYALNGIVIFNQDQYNTLQNHIVIIMRVFRIVIEPWLSPTEKAQYYQNILNYFLNIDPIIKQVPNHWLFTDEIMQKHFIALKFHVKRNPAFVIFAAVMLHATSKTNNDTIETLLKQLTKPGSNHRELPSSIISSLSRTISTPSQQLSHFKQAYSNKIITNPDFGPDRVRDTFGYLFSRLDTSRVHNFNEKIIYMNELIKISLERFTSVEHGNTFIQIHLWNDVIVTLLSDLEVEDTHPLSALTSLIQTIFSHIDIEEAENQIYKDSIFTNILPDFDDESKSAAPVEELEGIPLALIFASQLPCHFNAYNKDKLIRLLKHNYINIRLLALLYFVNKLENGIETYNEPFISTLLSSLLSCSYLKASKILDNYSGKTNYLASVIKLLLDNVSPKTKFDLINCSLENIDGAYSIAILLLLFDQLDQIQTALLIKSNTNLLIDSDLTEDNRDITWNNWLSVLRLSPTPSKPKIYNLYKIALENIYLCLGVDAPSAHQPALLLLHLCHLSQTNVANANKSLAESVQNSSILPTSILPILTNILCGSASYQYSWLEMFAEQLQFRKLNEVLFKIADDICNKLLVFNTPHRTSLEHALGIYLINMDAHFRQRLVNQYCSTLGTTIPWLVSFAELSNNMAKCNDNSCAPIIINNEMKETIATAPSTKNSTTRVALFRSKNIILTKSQENILLCIIEQGENNDETHFKNAVRKFAPHGILILDKLLIHAARYNQESITLWIIQYMDHYKSGNINFQDEDDENNTALHNAVINNNSTVVSALIRAGAKSSICNENSYTVLTLASELKHFHLLDVIRNTMPQSGLVYSSAQSKV
ncbi:MAG: ankyrin repeat domain-containing protein [Gammaproteobacteria bacterium]